MTVLTISQDTLIMLPDGATGGTVQISYNGTTVGPVIASGDDQGRAVIVQGRLAKLTALDGKSPLQIAGREAGGRLPARVTLRIYPTGSATVAPIILSGLPVGSPDAPGIWNLSNIDDASGGMDVILPGERQAIAVLRERAASAADQAEAAAQSASGAEAKAAATIGQLQSSISSAAQAAAAGTVARVDAALADTAQTGAEARAMGAEALTRVGSKTYRYDSEREADNPPDGTNSYTIESRTNHTRAGDKWVLVGSAVASAAEVTAAGRAAAWGARTAERAAPRLSVNVCPLPHDVSDYEPDFLRLRADFGNEYARIAAYLNYIDPDKNGNINWSYSDPFLRACGISGLSPLLTIQTNPGAQEYGRPTPAQFARVVDQLITRYAPGSNWYAQQGLQPPQRLILQIWNEQDQPGFWGGKPDAVEYAAMLRVCAQVVRSRTSGDVRIITGGLTMEGLDWLSQMFAADPGVAGLIDGVAVHPYLPDNSWPTKDGPATEWGGLTMLRGARAIVDGYNDSLPLWATETGFSVAPTGLSLRTVRPDDQADYLIRMVEAVREHPELRVEMLNLFADRDSPGDAGWGLRDGNDVARPAYRRLSDHLRQRGNSIRPTFSAARLHGLAAARMAGADLRTVPAAAIDGTMRGTRNAYGPALMADRPGTAPVIPFEAGGSYTVVAWTQLPADLSQNRGVIGLRQASGDNAGTLFVHPDGLIGELLDGVAVGALGSTSLKLQPSEHVALALRWDADTGQILIAVAGRQRGMQTSALMFAGKTMPAVTHLVPGAIFNRDSMLLMGSVNAALGYTYALSLRELEALLTGEPPMSDGYALAERPYGGSWQRGTTINNVLVGQNPFAASRFVCTESGSPGTWAERFDMGVATIRLDAFNLAAGASRDLSFGAPGCTPGAWAAASWSGTDAGQGKVGVVFLHEALDMLALAGQDGVNLRIVNRGSVSVDIPAGFWRVAYN